MEYILLYIYIFFSNLVSRDDYTMWPTFSPFLIIIYSEEEVVQLLNGQYFVRLVVSFTRTQCESKL